MSSMVIPADVPTHDNTMMSAYATCERLYALEHVLHRRSIFTRQALDFGSLMHIGLDAFYRHLPKHSADRDNAALFAAAEAAVLAMSNADYDDPLDDYRTRQRGIEVLVDYVKEYQHDRDWEDIIFTETAHEVTFSDGYRWGGIIDLWVRRQGLSVLVDHKSTSVFGEDGSNWYSQFKRSPQMLGYMLTGAELHGEWPGSVCINAIIVNKTKHRFDRRYFPFPPWLVAEAKRMQVRNYKQIAVKRAATESIADCFDDQIWTPNLYNCVGKYGKCSMYGICDSEPENRLRVLNNETEEREWDWRVVRE